MATDIPAGEAAGAGADASAPTCVAGVPPLVAVLGRGVVGPDEPVVTADDLGLTRGDGCFDATRVVTDEDGVARVDHLAEHLDRLAESAARLDLVPPPHEEWEALLAEMLAQWHHPGEAILKLMLTRGREWAPGRPVGIATLVYRGRTDRATPGADPFKARRGLKVALLSKGHPSDAYRDAPWLLGGTKTLSYVVNLAAQREGARRGADDILFTTTDGFCLDGPTSGLVVIDGDVLRSTPLEDTGLLASVTVTRVMEAARADGLDARYELIPVADLFTADGVWLVSSSRGPAPVTHLDGRPLDVKPELVARLAGYAGF